MPMVLGFDWASILVALVGGLLGAPVFAYIGKRFLYSGRAQLPPQELWKEARHMRAVQDREIERLGEVIEHATEDVFNLRGQVLEVGAKASSAERAVRRWRDRAHRAEGELERLRSRGQGGP